MKTVNHKKKIEEEVYIYIKENFQKPDTLDIFNKSSSNIYYYMYDIKISIYYSRNSSSGSIEHIQLSVGNEEIAIYRNIFNKRYRLYKNILKYFLKAKEDNRYMNLYKKLTNNKPVNVKRKEKYQKLKKS
jgi:hypothetical protein